MESNFKLGALVDAILPDFDAALKDGTLSDDEINAKAQFDALSTEEKLDVYKEVVATQANFLISQSFISPFMAEKIAKTVDENNTVLDIRLAIYNLLMEAVGSAAAKAEQTEDEEQPEEDTDSD